MKAVFNQNVLDFIVNLHRDIDHAVDFTIDCPTVSRTEVVSKLRFGLLVLIQVELSHCFFQAVTCFSYCHIQLFFLILVHRNATAVQIWVLYSTLQSKTGNLLFKFRFIMKERLRELIAELGISMREFSRRCDLSASYIRNVTDNPSSKTVNNILAAFPQVNREWLLKGEGEMFIEVDNVIDEVVTYKMLYEAKKIEADELRKRVDELMDMINQEHLRTFALTEEVTRLSRLVLVLNNANELVSDLDENKPEKGLE